jgi:GTP-binding protein EngB required for normal cell division
MTNSNGKRATIMKAILDIIEDEARKPLKVSVMGQTGVGKSSLINALFGTDLPMDPVRPGTTEIKQFATHGKNGQEVIFYDLPGVGETALNGREWLPKYKEYLEKSDVVIWAILADTRSFMLDQTTLEEIIKGVESAEEKTILLSKIVFALTKTDHLTDPKNYVHWLSVKAPDNNKEVILIPDVPLTDLIKQIEEYFQERFLGHFKSRINARTYYKGRFKVEIPGMTYEEGFVHYNHFVGEEYYKEWCKQYPKYKDVFRRLREGCRIIPCSAHFRYNLDLLMNVIIEKLDTSSAGHFGGFVEEKPMDRIPYMVAKRLINIVSLDAYEESFQER